MAKTSKERIAERKKLNEDYTKIRELLLKIAFEIDTSKADRLTAILLIYKLDSDGVPYPKY